VADDLAGRVVGFWGTFSNPAAPGNGTFTSTAYFRAPLRGNRLYFVNCTPIQINNSNLLGNEEVTHRWIASDTNGGGPTTYAQTTQTVANSPGKNALTQGFLYAFSNDPFASNTTTFALQSSATSNTTSFTNVGGWNLYCMDVGPMDAAMNDGALGAPAGSIQRTTIYPATDSQTYNGSSNPIGSDDEVWRGDFGDGNGNTRSIVCFDGAQIRSDLTGATVQAAKLHMYCIEASENRGTVAFEYSTASTPPGTLGAGSVDYSFSDDFPEGQMVGVDILGGFLDDILNNSANSMHICSTVLGLAETKFAGYADAATRPFLEITYTK
jgi:hypothetical protein